MKYRKLTATGDYTFGQKEQNFISGVEAVAQAIKTKVLLFYGEWWEDTSIGIPMFQSILGQIKNNNVINALTYMVENRIKEISDVRSVTKVQTKIEDRKIDLNIDCLTVNNEEVEVEIQI